MASKLIPEDIESSTVPSLIVKKEASNFVIKRANLLFLNLMQKDREAIIGHYLDEVFPTSLEFRNYPHQNSLFEGLKEAGITGSKFQTPTEHYILHFNNQEIFEINKWALSITPLLNGKEKNIQMLVTVIEQ